MVSFIYPALGAAFALAGADKVTGDQGYMRMFKHLGWSREGMRAVAVAEIAGGALLAPRSTRRLGAAILTATSAAVLVSELKHEDIALAAPRGLLMLAAFVALLAPGKR